MTLEKVKQLIKQKENAKLDFKQEWYWNNLTTKQNLAKQKLELYKDIIAMTNGNVHYIGQPTYLLIGVIEGTPNKLKHVNFNVDELQQEIINGVNNYATPLIQDLSIIKHTIESKDIFIIEIPPHPFPIILKQDLKGLEKKNTLLIRAGEGTVVVDNANYETRKVFEEALKKFEKNKKLKYFWKIIGALFISVSIAMTFIYDKDKKRDNSTKESVLFPKWNESEAEKVVLNELLKYEKIKKNNFGFKKKITHSIIKFSLLEDVNYHKPKKIAIIETSDYTWCHACGVQLSFIEFVQVSSGWILGQIDINVMQSGSWGENNDGIEISSIGENIFGIIHTGSFGNQGIFSDYFTLSTLIAGEYVDVFSTETSTSNAGAVGENHHSYYDWNATISFEEGEQTYHDLIVLKQGFRDKKNFKEKILYKFNGIEYKEVEVTNYILSKYKLSEIKSLSLNKE